MSNQSNSQLVKKSQTILKQLGYEVKTGHLYEMYSQLSGYPSFNVASAKNASLNPFGSGVEQLANIEKLGHYQIRSGEGFARVTEINESKIVGLIFNNEYIHGNTNSRPASWDRNGKSLDSETHYDLVKLLDPTRDSEFFAELNEDGTPISYAEFEAREKEAQESRKAKLTNMVARIKQGGEFSAEEVTQADLDEIYVDGNDQITFTCDPDSVVEADLKNGETKEGFWGGNMMEWPIISKQGKHLVLKSCFGNKNESSITVTHARLGDLTILKK